MVEVAAQVQRLVDYDAKVRVIEGNNLTRARANQVLNNSFGDQVSVRHLLWYTVLGN
jgi:hypothetical protein